MGAKTAKIGWQWYIGYNLLQMRDWEYRNQYWYVGIDLLKSLSLQSMTIYGSNWAALF